MTDNLKKLITGFFGKTLNLSDAEVAALLYSNADGTEIKTDALDTLLSKDASRIAKFKDERQTYHDNGYKKAQKEALSKLENQVKEKYGITTGAKGITLIEEIVAKNKTGDNNQILEEDKVKIHPLYTKTVNELNKRIKETENIWKGKYEEREKGLAKENAFKGVQAKAKNILDSLKPILPTDNTKAERQLNWFFNDLGQFEFQEQDGSVLILKDGKLLEDGHGNRVNFDTFVKEKAGSYWDFQQGTAKAGTGNGKDGKTTTNTTNTGDDVKVPKDKSEYARMIAEAETPEQRIAIADAFEKAQAATV